MLLIENPRKVMIAFNDHQIEGTVEGSQDDWLFKSQNVEFTKEFPLGEFSLLELKAKDPYNHKTLAAEISHQVVKILSY